ncbi:hypothetical protein Hdeb2414_s0049g00750201 [Helianthus debilis subsp. tardiflorus]
MKAGHHQGGPTMTLSPVHDTHPHPLVFEAARRHPPTTSIFTVARQRERKRRDEQRDRKGRRYRRRWTPMTVSRGGGGGVFCSDRLHETVKWYVLRLVRIFSSVEVSVTSQAQVRI